MNQTLDIDDNMVTYDPSYNVRAFVQDAKHRLDELREAETRRVNEIMVLERNRLNERLQIISNYNKELALAEAKRIDAIRAVDVAAVSVANERATAQAVVLANQVSASAETLRALVATTATATAAQLSQLTSQLTDRLTQLEKAQYENKGKTGVSDPMMTEMMLNMQKMMTSQSENRGSRGGIKDAWAWAVAALGIALALYQASK